MDFLKEFGSNIRKYRELNKYSQEKLAELMDVSLTTINNIERGLSFITADNLEKLAKILKTTTYKFFNSDEPSNGKYLNMIIAKAKTMTVEQQQHLLKIMQTFD